MSTKETNGVASALFSKTCQAVLSLLFSRPGEAFYVREVVRAAKVGQGAVQRELKRLEDAGILERTSRGRQVFYQANRRCPIFAELQQLIVKTAGVADVIRLALAPLVDRIALAFIFGSFAAGGPRKDSDIDVLVVGEVTFAQVVSALSPVQGQLGRDVNSSVYPRTEFCEKIAAGHHFLTSVLAGPKVFVIGGERELAGLVQKRLAHRAQAKPTRNKRPVRRRRS